MTEEEAQPLSYVQETVLKKRKNNEEWAIKRRERVEARKQRNRDDLKHAIKKPEQFVQEYRDKELDLVRMKQRLRLRKTSHVDFKSKLLFVIRIQGSNDMHPKTKKILKLLRLTHIFSGIFVKANERTLKLLLCVEPFVTYGYPNMKNVKELIYKKGCGIVDKQRVPLIDNIVIEQVLINVPWLYLAFNYMTNFFLTLRTKRESLCLSSHRDRSRLCSTFSSGHNDQDFAIQ